MGLKFNFKKLLAIQQKIKAPKNQHNKFADYDYRSLDDILNAAKPLCFEQGLVLLLSDTVKTAGHAKVTLYEKEKIKQQTDSDKNYIEATAILIDTETGESYSVTASARESDYRKGMDDSQTSGSASSYARKIACNGLFALDDTKDVDGLNNNNGDNGPINGNNKPVDTNPKPPTENPPQEEFVEIKGNTCLVKTSQGMVDIKRLNLEQLNIIYHNPNYKKAQPFINGLLDAKG